MAYFASVTEFFILQKGYILFLNNVFFLLKNLHKNFLHNEVILFKYEDHFKQPLYWTNKNDSNSYIANSDMISISRFTKVELEYLLNDIKETTKNIRETNDLELILSYYHSLQGKLKRFLILYRNFLYHNPGLVITVKSLSKMSWCLVFTGPFIYRI